MAALAEVLLSPLDAVRRRLLLLGGPVARPLVTRRALRVAVSGSLLVSASLAVTLLVPLWVLALSPIVWGVPHLLADVRYLVVRPGHHKRRLLWVLVGLPVLGAGLGLGSQVGFLATAGALVAARGRVSVARAAGIGGAVVLAMLAWRVGWIADLVMAHVHNFVAVALWWAWRPRATRHHWVVLALFVAATVALFALPLPLVAAHTAGAPGGLDLTYHVDWLASGVDGPLATRLVLAFAFAQAVHYGLWVRVIPDEDRPRETTRGFAASLRALRADLGTWPLVICLVVALGLAGWALADLEAARRGYFRLAMFHGHLELAAAALLVIEGRPGHVRSGRAAEGPFRCR